MYIKASQRIDVSRCTSRGWPASSILDRVNHNPTRGKEARNMFSGAEEGVVWRSNIGPLAFFICRSIAGLKLLVCTTHPRSSINSCLYLSNAFLAHDCNGTTIPNAVQAPRASLRETSSHHCFRQRSSHGRANPCDRAQGGQRRLSSKPMGTDL